MFSLRRGLARGTAMLLLFLAFLAGLGASLAYFKPEYAQAVLTGIGAFTILFGLMIMGKIRVTRG
ncbi:MAG: hypothetical protein GSR84_04520 [Desulfurococcales archaeon]|nr:hypothetical protein [Desulfurococcales archaeon]